MRDAVEVLKDFHVLSSDKIVSKNQKLEIDNIPYKVVGFYFVRERNTTYIKLFNRSTKCCINYSAEELNVLI